MSVEFSTDGEEGPPRINVNQPYELRDWANRFGVSKQELQDAVKSVGDRAEEVAEYLRAS